MYLTKHYSPAGPRWAADGKFLPQPFNLALLLEISSVELANVLRSVLTDEPAEGPILAPIDPIQEVWACGVTYLRSREARQAESEVADVYELVYEAERPELFFKSIGWRAVGHGEPIRVRQDSTWDVPEPELTLVISRHREIVGYCVGNDVSSRSIEGANPLYLPQAKMYNGACAIGPGIQLAAARPLSSIPIQIAITRDEAVIFAGETSSNQMKRSLEELVHYLFLEMDFPYGAFLMTGTGLVPSDDFTLQAGDTVRITIAELILENPVAE